MCSALDSRPKKPTHAREKPIRSFLLFFFFTYPLRSLVSFRLKEPLLFTHILLHLWSSILGLKRPTKSRSFSFSYFLDFSHKSPTLSTCSPPPPSSISYSSSLCCYPTLGRGELTLGVLLYDTYSTHETRLDEGEGYIVLRKRTGWCTFSLFLFLFRWVSCCQRNNARRRTPHRLRSRRAWDSALFLLLESCCGRCTRLGVTVDTLGSVEWEDMGRVWYVLQINIHGTVLLWRNFFLTLVCFV